MSAANWGMGGGGLNIFFFGAEMSTETKSLQKTQKLGVQTPVGLFSTQFLQKMLVFSPKNGVFKVFRRVEPILGETKLLKLC